MEMQNFTQKYSNGKKSFTATEHNAPLECQKALCLTISENNNLFNTPLPNPNTPYNRLHKHTLNNCLTHTHLLDNCYT